MNRPKRASKRSEPTTAKERAAAEANKPLKWKDAVAEQPDEKFLAYDGARRFNHGALVLHAKFGRGIITEVDGNKISILFEDGTKKLMHGG